MSAEFVAALSETLKQTLVPDSNVIKQASQKLTKEFYTNPNIIAALFHILQSSEDNDLKLVSAVETRKLVISSWDKVDETTSNQIKSNLLQISFSQPTKSLRRSYAKLIAAVAEQESNENSFNEILSGLINYVQDSNVEIKESAVLALLSILETSHEALHAHIGQFLQLFSNLLVDQSSIDVRVNSVISLDILGQFIEDAEPIDTRLANEFKNTIPGMVNVLKEVIANDDSDNVKQIFNVFNGFVYLDNKLIGDHLINLLQFIGEISANTDIDEEYRNFGLQFIISLVDTRKTKISSNKLGPQLTLMAVKIASEEIDVEAELSTEEEENENEENSPSTLALRLIAGLSSNLPTSQVVTPLIETLPSMISSSNQFERRAGLLSIGVASTGAPDFVSNQVPKLLPIIVTGLKDSSQIVRVAALRTLTEFTSELQDNIATFHEELLPLIFENIDSATSIKAYKYGCSALDGLIEFMDHDAMGQYIEPLMNKLFTMLHQASSSSLQCTIVSAIGSTAFASGKAFTPYFNKSIELLEPLITQSTSTEGLSEDDIELRAITFENISTMARAVGSESFAVYAKPLVEASYNCLSSDHSRIRESGFAFISNMAKVYGTQFSEFLDQIIPKIIECFEQDEFTFNVDAFDEDGEEEDLENKFNVNTGITIEKEIAAVALGELAIGTGAAFTKYIEVSVKTLIEQVENSYGMRETALNTLFKITRAYFDVIQGKDFKAPKGVPQTSYVDSSVLELINQVKNFAVELLAEEFEPTMVACILDGISASLNDLGSIAIIDSPSQTSQLESLCVQLMQLIKKEHPCQIEEEEVPEDEDDSSETDALIYDRAVEVLISLADALEGDFIKVFGSFKDLLIKNVSSKSKTIRSTSVGALAEIAAGVKSTNPYSQELLEVFTDRIANDKSFEVKGNAAYGIGLIIENSSVDLTAAYPTILQLLFQLLSKIDKKATSVDDDESSAIVNRSYANACGCVARLILKHEQAVPLEHVIGPLLSHLPLETGFEENAPIFKVIIKLYASNNALIVNETQKIIDIFAKVFIKEADRIKLVNESTLGREENLDAMKQFETPEIKAEVIALLKSLDQKFNGVVSANEVLRSVIA
ncbi:ran binding protein [Scheffersomyces amazonensis]|uniref:ran binding protein n=1 Tax=Scheffersomyces amazonensis TaxID=1078765 RepID=UPI00315CA166